MRRAIDSGERHLSLNFCESETAMPSCIKRAADAGQVLKPRTTTTTTSRRSKIIFRQKDSATEETKMNAKIFALFVLVLVECIYASSIPEDNIIGLHEQMDSTRVRLLEKKLREDIQRELRDIGELEIQLNRNLDLVHEKKRQLEIKRSQPVQCLVNADSCFLKK